MVVWFGFGVFKKHLNVRKKNWWWFGLVLGGIYYIFFEKKKFGDGLVLGGGEGVSLGYPSSLVSRCSFICLFVCWPCLLPRQGYCV